MADITTQMQDLGLSDAFPEALAGRADPTCADRPVSLVQARRTPIVAAMTAAGRPSGSGLLRLARPVFAYVLNPVFRYSPTFPGFIGAFAGSDCP